MEINLKLNLSGELVELIEKEQTLEGYFHVTFAKKRNLLVNLTNYIIKSEKEKKFIFSEKEIVENILMKEIDRKIYLEEFFEKEESNVEYELKEEIKEKIKVYIEKYLKNKDIAKEKELEETYSKLKDMITSGKIERNKYQKLISEGVELAKNLHWKYLPIYNEQMILNRECTPEEDLKNYYNHYHAIKDLLEVIKGNRMTLEEKNGDLTLNKKLDFKVYSNRWNGYDIYQFERTIYGWDISFLSIEEESLKNGENGLFRNLEHDSIFYPKEGVKYALEILWEKADNGEINLEELKIKLQEVAYWISDVERNLREKQPEWCNYY